MLILEFLKDILPVVGVLFATFIGGYISRKSQVDLFEKEWEKEKQAKIDKDVNEILKIYTEIIRLDGELALIEHHGNLREFNLNTYLEEMRPKLFNNYHLIHSDVASLIRSIDRKVEECDYYEEIDENNHEFLVDDYLKILTSIESHIEAHRKNKWGNINI
ncbi:hypothetical protein [Amphibacillus jilinensis]|uniref:hypothetical protein n=1 Tax=Amphibacillus jilinensis TaxID=1216008 RepID=UPI0003009EDF|nr:hypothetical protein [Amphibacillus jilinensis]